MEAIKVEMTWEQILNTLLLLIESGDAEGRKAAREELTRMAVAADQAVAHEKEREKDEGQGLRWVLLKDADLVDPETLTPEERAEAKKDLETLASVM